MSCRVRLHPLVESDLARMRARLLPFAGPQATRRRLLEFNEFRRGLALVPHRGTIRDEVAPGVRVIPAGPGLTVAFVVDDAAREVLILVVAHGGQDWMGRARERV